MEDLSFNFATKSGTGSSLFKFASFKHNSSREKLSAGLVFFFSLVFARSSTLFSVSVSLLQVGMSGRRG